MPALALAEAFRAARSDVEPVLVGAERGVERLLLPERDYRYYLLSTEPIHRRALWRNLRWPSLAGRVLRECREVLDLERPSLVVGTGGYAAGPVLFSAVRRGLPIALQEQNAVPGLTTRLLARRARQLHLGFPEAKEALTTGPTTAVFAYGNPVSSRTRPADGGRAAGRAHLGIRPDAQVVLVTGGSQGSLIINQAVGKALDLEELADVTVLWSTGPVHWEGFKTHHQPPLRQLRPFWDPLAEALEAADLVVARAGAMTIADICACSLPSILVPLGTAAGGHQTHNARAMARSGAAIHVPEEGLGGRSLATTVQELLRDPARMAQMGSAAAARGAPDAARKIVAALLEGVS